MVKVEQAVRGHPLLTFYALAFAIAWVGYLPALAADHGNVWFLHPAWRLCLVLPGAAPGLAAWLTVSMGAERPRGQPPGLLSAFRFRSPLRWYLFALVVPIVLVWLSNYLAVRGHFEPSTTSAPLASSLALFAAVSMVANPCEELGWRGFALPRLLARHGVVVASLVVFVLWAAWHLPLFYLSSGPVAMASVPPVAWTWHLLFNTFVLAWLFIRSGQSVAVTSVFHISTNLAASALVVRSDSAYAIVGAVFACGLFAWRWPMPPPGEPLRLASGVRSPALGQATTSPVRGRPALRR